MTTRSKADGLRIVDAPAGVSRRIVLGGAAAIGFGVGAACFGAAQAQTKMSQADAKYVDKAPAADKCSGCALFQAPDACQGVDGKISPDGWCSLYSPKA